LVVAAALPYYIYASLTLQSNSESLMSLWLLLYLYHVYRIQSLEPNLILKFVWYKNRKCPIFRLCGWVLNYLSWKKRFRNDSWEFRELESWSQKLTILFQWWQWNKITLAVLSLLETNGICALLLIEAYFQLLIFDCAGAFEIQPYFLQFSKLPDLNTR